MASSFRSLQKCAASLSDWERKCSVQHGDKCYASIFAESPFRYVPDWVIDTDQGCIVPGKQVDKYAALSYVWNSPVDSRDNAAADRLLLQRDTLEDLQRPDYLSFSKTGKRLPMVIKHAIQLVSLSGMRYLWVDCLCIIQNDESTRDKVAFLPEIYSGALFTIIAATEANGLCGSMADTHAPPQNVSMESLHGELIASRWATRGWTFQEQMLSKRSIIFLESTFFWDCEGFVRWPTNQPPHEPSRDREASVSTTMLNEGIIDTDRNLPRELASDYVTNLALYRELACRFNYRDLTHPQDALQAFSGVLDALTPYFHGGFINGLPRLALDLALIWQPLSKAKRRVAASTGQELAPSSALPSWSWIGWQCLIDPASLQKCLQSLVSSAMPRDLSINAGSTSASFLSRTTTSAELRIRRILFPRDRVKQPNQLEARFSVPISDTSRYKDREVNTLCPVITLENCEGEWAGLLRLTDDGQDVNDARNIEVVAVSQGSCSYWDAASTYEATVDRLGCYKFEHYNGDHYHFESSDNVPLASETCEKILAGSIKKMPTRLHPSPVFFENRLSGRDQGPFFPRNEYYSHSGYEEELPKAWHRKIYEFYDVLWVETRDNVKYRKAAGRVPKKVWEQSCGAPHTIMLG